MMKILKSFVNYQRHTIIGALALVIAACVINFKRAVGLLAMACATVFFLIWDAMMERYGERLWEGMYPIRRFFSSKWYWVKWWETWMAPNFWQQDHNKVVLVFLTELCAKHLHTFRSQEIINWHQRFRVFFFPELLDSPVWLWLQEPC